MVAISVPSSLSPSCGQSKKVTHIKLCVFAQSGVFLLNHLCFCHPVSDSFRWSILQKKAASGPPGSSLIGPAAAFPARTAASTWSRCLRCPTQPGHQPHSGGGPAADHLPAGTQRGPPEEQRPLPRGGAPHTATSAQTLC